MRYRLVCTLCRHELSKPQQLSLASKAARLLRPALLGTQHEHELVTNTHTFSHADVKSTSECLLHRFCMYEGDH
jgi:hypothetical protein